MDLPVVGEEFVLDCANRENSGIKLRQRKHLKADGCEGASRRFAPSDTRVTPSLSLPTATTGTSWPVA